jgi:hypothetical protein
MFRATMCPSSGHTSVFMRHLVLVILCGRLERIPDQVALITRDHMKFAAYVVIWFITYFVSFSHSMFQCSCSFSTPMFHHHHLSLSSEASLRNFDVRHLRCVITKLNSNWDN